MTWLRSVLAFSAVAAMSASLAGCFGCGAVAVPTDKNANATASVDSMGVVNYNPTPVGQSVSFDIPVKDSADVSEKLMGATIRGADASAFEVHATFPMDMPAGAQVHIEVTFHPTKLGQAAAELMVETEAMGVSPIPLTGVGTAADGS